MSKSNKKKVVVTKSKKAKTVTPTVSKRAAGSVTAKAKTVIAPEDMMFSRENYIWMIGSVVLILVGLGLMSGGAMPSPDVWDENIIYSFRRTVLAPFVILSGLGVAAYAIFK